MKKWTMVLFAVMALGLSACGGGDDDTTNNSNNNSSSDMCGGLCQTGQYCWNGICANGCTSDENCASDEYCVIDDEFFNEGRCHGKAAPSGCTSDDQCASTQVCQMGACVAPVAQPSAACAWKPDLTDGCPAEQLCFQGDEEEGTQSECYAMPGCGVDGACPKDFGGSVCNVKADGSRIIPSKAAICLMGACLADTDCPSGQKCEDLFGGLGYCDMGMGIGDGCETDADCDEGKVCHATMCVPDTGVDSCETDADCADGEVCQASICIIDMGDGDCQTDDDCGADEVCEMGFCMPDMGF